MIKMIFSSSVKIEEEKYMNQRNKKTGFFLSKFTKYLKTCLLQQSRTKYFIKVKL